MLGDEPLRDLLAAFASSKLTPGGGSAAAVASAVGASLLLMVAALPRTRSASADDRTALAAATGPLTDLQQQFIEAIDDDTAAYDQVVGARKLPQANETERAARKAAIEHALRRATNVPLGVMRLSALALKHAQVVAGLGQRGALSDVGVAITLLRVGLHSSARLNVEMNLPGLPDGPYVNTVRADVERL